MQYKQAIQTIKSRRATQLQDASAVDAMLVNNDTEYYANAMAIGRATLDNNTKMLTLLHKNRLALASKHGISKEQLYPMPSCALCNDTCYNDGTICQCVIRAYLQLQSQALPTLELNSFDNLDMSFYDNPATMQKRIDIIKEFCQKFPSTKSTTLLWYGNTGTGKTHLASCLAYSIIRKGYSVLFVSAFQFFASMQRYHTTFDDTRLDSLLPYLETDLLIVDDLGREIIQKNITIEYLHNIINERQIAHKHTLFTSNLNINQIHERYGAPIGSRLLNKNSLQLAFDGIDLRVKLGYKK